MHVHVYFTELLNDALPPPLAHERVVCTHVHVHVHVRLQNLRRASQEIFSVAMTKRYRRRLDFRFYGMMYMYSWLCSAPACPFLL